MIWKGESVVQWLRETLKRQSVNRVFETVVPCIFACPGVRASG